MWAQGGKVACGVVTENTKVVYRSSTSMVYLFIQMSSEMWDFDLYGDLYFEKAVSGFLSELFAKWKKESSNHDVTIVLFSRTYYKATSIDEFPTYMRECLQEDYRGRFYEDFYRWVMAQDQTGVLIQQHHYQVSSRARGNNSSSSPLPTPDGDTTYLTHLHHHHHFASTPTKNGPASPSAEFRMYNGSGMVEVNGMRPRNLNTQHSQESINGVRRESRPRTTSQNSSLASVDITLRGAGTPQKAGGAGVGGGLRLVGGVNSGKAKFPATLIWGATGEQEWNAGLTTGVDWKSLTLPACLPITTDYFPEEQSLHNDYVVADYNLLVDEPEESVRRPLTTKMVFLELVSQRLAQGFQMIMLAERGGVGGAGGGELVSGSASSYSGVGSFIRNRSRTHHNTVTQEYRLSIGRIFHKILLYGSTITVTIYRPRCVWLMILTPSVLECISYHDFWVWLDSFI
ncbi:DEP domain-containing protein 5 [Portunus trituberculatus]|uniref:DEP domain-containing protein 5 n=1 Tax=Portunus trituberculatus TaxID=210409 RepID=A0A5B7DK09_PORTR|nr:DEP domain-containing protein 5 [Portunus trituberculatus]